MRRLSLMISSLFTVAAMSAPSFAAEPGTYRPGSPYLSVQSSAPDACAAQCSGDAQCKGWNFVKVKRQATVGVCEFNSQVASPIPSPISISGNASAVRNDARLTPAGSNTVRVGTPVMPKRPIQAKTAKRPAPQARMQRKSPTRRVVREAVPQRAAPRGTAHRAPGQTLAQQQNMQRALTGMSQVPQTRQVQRPAAPRFQHNLEGGPMPGMQQHMQQQQRPMAPGAMPQGHGPQGSGPQGDPAQMMQQRLMEYQMRERMRQQAGGAPAPGMAPQNPAPMAAPQRAPQPQGPLTQAPQRAPMQTPIAAQGPHTPGPNYIPQQHAQAPAAPRSQMAPQAQRPAQPQQRPMTMAQAEQSLFGSLHDDVAQPRPMTPQEANNPDAPIATVQAVPVKKVTTETLFGLAGGPRQ